MTNEERSLIEVVERIVHRRRDQDRISPAWIATEAMVEIDPKKRSPHLVYVGAHLYFRQIARGQLRKHFEDDEGEAEMRQHKLFPDLQRMYPSASSAKSEEHEYVVLERMTLDDIKYNVNRLRSEADSKMRHADALEAYGRKLKRRA